MSTEYLQKQTRKFLSKEAIDEDDFAKAINLIFLEEIPDSTIASFLAALTFSGVSGNQLKIVRDIMLQNSLQITPRIHGALIDNCGTGGDLSNSFSISTAASIVASASGINVAKHGNRSASGLFGSADFFEYIGLDLSLPDSRIIESLEKLGYAFLFAPKFHPKLRRISGIRKRLRFRTIFNLIGPLCNPCTNITSQVIGISDPKSIELVSSAMLNSNLKKIFLVHSLDGMDELSNTSRNVMVVLKSGKVERQEVDPKLLDMKVVKKEKIQIRSVEDSVKATLQTIYGKSTSARQDIVVLNAAVALIAGERATDMNEGIKITRELVKSEAPRTKLRELISSYGNIQKLDDIEKQYSLQSI
ncbi:MAG TPA: anthranilate phosphoribosyltransferase [Nitrososphaeraceae archaeon]|nr:anthranilate phosphoribosyltransferase [Nitrososphaeraceae archaeon]